MTDESQPTRLSPSAYLFPPEYRASGVLLHITSLPSPYGISLPDDQRQNMCRVLGKSSIDGGQVAAELLRLAWSSVATLAIAPLQDLLNLEADARMNVPGHMEGNWRWRSTAEMLSASAFQWLRDLTKACQRSVAR